MKISDLHLDIISQLPISLQLSKQDIDFNDLPSDIQYIIQQPDDDPPIIEYENKDQIYDLRPELSIYNDLEITNLKKTILDYFKNYLYITISSYPFDVTMGNNVKQAIHSKDTSLQQTLLGNELKNISSELADEFDSNINIANINIKNIPRLTSDNHISTDINISLDLEILDETFVINQLF